MAARAQSAEPASIIAKPSTTPQKTRSRRGGHVVPTKLPTRVYRLSTRSASEPVTILKNTRCHGGMIADASIPQQYPVDTRRITRSRSVTFAEPIKEPFSSIASKAEGPTAAKQNALNTQASSISTRDGYGSSHAATESTMMQAHAESLLSAGLIDASQAERLSIPWHDKGILNHSVWDSTHIDPSKKVNFEIMTLGAAQKRQWKRDKFMKKFVEDFEAGRIDENGSPTEQEVDIIDEDMVGGDTINLDDGEAPATIPSPRKTLMPKKPSGKTRKSLEPALPTITEASSPLVFPHQTPAAPSLAPPRLKTIVLTHSRKPLSADSDPKLPTYKDYGYYELLAIARHRGLKSGGKTSVLLARIQEDDKAMRDGTERKELSPYSTRRETGGQRAYKTRMSDVERAHKRKRDEDEDEDEAGKADEAHKRGRK